LTYFSPYGILQIERGEVLVRTNRRDFLKLSGAGIGVAAVLSLASGGVALLPLLGCRKEG